MTVVRGKRGCSLKLAFLLHALGFVALLLGYLTPYWSKVKDEATDETQLHEGLLLLKVPGKDWTLRDFNTLKEASSNKTVLYLALSVGFGLGAIFVEFFLLEAFAFALYNASCGVKYNPDWLMIFSLLSGLTAITSLVLFEQYTGRDFNASTDVKLDYSRGFVIIYVAATFLSAFVMVCDRKETK